jgi:hypothetical protein
MKYLLFLSLALCLKSVSAQSFESDWDTYQMEVNGKPVSVVVDLGLARIAPMKNRPHAIIVRTRILKPDAVGQPGKSEAARLDELKPSGRFFPASRNTNGWPGAWKTRHGPTISTCFTPLRSKWKGSATDGWWIS